jgi:hypothetical protein
VKIARDGYPDGRHQATAHASDLPLPAYQTSGAAGMDMAAMGIEILTEAQFGSCRRWGDFRSKTSIWVKTPPESENAAALFFAIAVTTTSSRKVVPWRAEG